MRVGSGKYLQSQLRANTKHRQNNAQYYRNKRMEYYYMSKLKDTTDKWLNDWDYIF